MLTNQSNQLVHDPVPKNVSKFPIHQTYLTDDAERTGSGGYRFKAPEVWSSARSGKKSIAIRSIQRLKEESPLSFTIIVYDTTVEFGEGIMTWYFNFNYIAGKSDTLGDVLDKLLYEFNEVWAKDQMYVSEALESTKYATFALTATYSSNVLTFKIVNTSGGENPYIMEFKANGIENVPPESLNIYLNQPQTLMKPASDTISFTNVWDHTKLYFHASFIPFDSYQLLGELYDEWSRPIIFQDPNTSPLFNVWVTDDLKTPVTLLHEAFVIRMSFIISTADNYH